MFVLGGVVFCAWLEGAVVWLDGRLVWAWLVELFDAGAWVVLVPVPELDGWLAAFWPVADGDCVWAVLVEGVLCADPEEDGEVVDVDSCRCVVDGLKLVLGEDCAKAEVAMATTAVVAKNKRLFIGNLPNVDVDQPSTPHAVPIRENLANCRDRAGFFRRAGGLLLWRIRARRLKPAPRTSIRSQGWLYQDQKQALQPGHLWSTTEYPA